MASDEEKKPTTRRAKPKTIKRTKKKNYPPKKDANEMLAEQILKNIQENNLVFPTRERKPGNAYKSGNSSFGSYSGINALRTDEVAEKSGYVDKAVEKYGKDLGMILANKYVTYKHVSDNPDMFGEYAMKGKKSDLSITMAGSQYWNYEVDGKMKRWKPPASDPDPKREPTKSEIDNLGLNRKFGSSQLKPVFNIMQFDEVPEKIVNEAKRKLEELIENPIQHMENADIRQDVSEAMGIKINETMNIEDNVGGFYSPNQDSISLRPAAVYEDESHLMRIFFHEMTHATGAEDRLNRSTLRDYSKSSDIRAKEELVAELGAAFMCQHFGIGTDKLGHEGYLNSWMKKLGDDPSFFKDAVFEASKASKLIIDKYENHYDKKYGVDVENNKDKPEKKKPKVKKTNSISPP